ncbi:hypothetical protein ACQUW5_07475 [Legionella sp. CNM-1927-20]|uniref:hypothetical protein n=1 Tax=Legionella sp. CNM-1927-20 TaxID=3422221 RepID=UPI00403B055A
MKYYICGIDLLNFNKLSLVDKAYYIGKNLAQINHDAKVALGDSYVVIIVLQEYALTTSSVTKEEKNQCLKILQGYVKEYENLILVPGSFSFYTLQVLNSKKQESKKRKLLDNYQKNEDLSLIDSHTEEQKELAQAAAQQVGVTSAVVHHAAYILSKGEMQKHHKSVPWQECGRLELPKDKRRLVKHSIFKIGADSPIKYIELNSKEKISAAVLLCREHGWDTEYTNKALIKNPPDVQIIMSDSIELQLSDSYGALIIYMDSRYGLKVFKNNAREYANQIESIVAKLYSLDYSQGRISLSYKDIEVTDYRYIKVLQEDLDNSNSVL